MQNGGPDLRFYSIVSEDGGKNQVPIEKRKEETERERERGLCTVLHQPYTRFVAKSKGTEGKEMGKGVRRERGRDHRRVVELEKVCGCVIVQEKGKRKGEAD